MIRRLLDRLARRLMDRDWLRAMRKSEVDSLRAVHHIERRQRRLNPISESAFPTHRGEKRP